MREKTPKRDWFYWFMALFTATQLPISALILLDFVLHPLAPDYDNQSTLFRLLTALGIVPLVVFVAILVIKRAPHNVTGLFLLLWVTITVGTTARRDPNVQILGSLGIGWVGIWFLPLFFPDGRAFPRRFEPYIRLLCVGLVLTVILWELSTPTIRSNNFPNPLFVPALEGLFPFVNTAEAVMLIITILLILPSVITRYRQSNRHVRQQMKWLGWVFFGILLTTIPLGISGLTTRDPQSLNPFERIIYLLWSAFITLAPFLAVGYAILRHRLYDIDIIIRRTLIYSLLTAALAALYFGGVVLAQAVLRPLTASSDLAIVLSTLGIAALVNPLRRRIQNTIDRRFFRRKYNAQKTLEAFSVATRDEVDLDKLQAALVGVVQETMQPTKIGLWLRESENSLTPDRTP